MAGNYTRKSMGGCHREARPGRDMAGYLMPKDMGELDQGRTDLQAAAQRLVINLSLENAVRTSLWYVSIYGAL